MENNSFEVGKYYKHSGGGVMHIIGAAKTMLYGWSLIAEEYGESNLKPVGQDVGCTVNWEQTTESEWMKGYSNESKNDTESDTVDK